MKWNEYKIFEKKYDIIITADPFFHKCSYENLYNIMLKFLIIGGSILISLLDDSKIKEFIKIVEEPLFEFEKIKLSHE